MLHETAVAGTPRRRTHWQQVLLWGIVLWVVSVLVALLTRDLVIVAPAVLIGSALVPVVGALWVIQWHWSGDVSADSRLTAKAAFGAFVPGGTLALLGSVCIEIWFAQLPPTLLLPIVACCESVAQGAAIAIVLGLCVPRPTLRDGIVLGVCVGFGFSVMETAGLLITEIVRSGVDPLPLLENLVLRGLLSPLGHATWAALLGGAVVLLLHARNTGVRRVSGALVLVLLVVCLHTLWDFSAHIGATVSAWLTGAPVTLQDFLLAWVTDATVRQAHIQNWVTFGILACVAATGVGMATLLWRRNTPRSAETPTGSR